MVSRSSMHLYVPYCRATSPLLGCGLRVAPRRRKPAGARTRGGWATTTNADAQPSHHSSEPAKPPAPAAANQSTPTSTGTSTTTPTEMATSAPATPRATSPPPQSPTAADPHRPSSSALQVVTALV
jgi:hypothetical protein